MLLTRPFTGTCQLAEGASEVVLVLRGGGGGGRGKLKKKWRAKYNINLACVSHASKWPAYLDLILSISIVYYCHSVLSSVSVLAFSIIMHYINIVITAQKDINNSDNFR